MKLFNKIEGGKKTLTSSALSHHALALLLLVKPFKHELLEKRLVTHTLALGQPLKPLGGVLLEAQRGRRDLLLTLRPGRR